tara:strand:+ start:4477 stop:4851 length:375 start_codon:yes stop_codon:yes gene_type:complete
MLATAFDIKKLKVDNTKFALTFLSYLNTFLFIAYVLLKLGVGFFYRRNRDRYLTAIDTFFKLCVGLLLCALAFPVVFRSLSNNNYKKEISSLMFPAGVIVLTSVSFNEIHDLINTIEYTLNIFS